MGFAPDASCLVAGVGALLAPLTGRIADRFGFVYFAMLIATVAGATVVAFVFQSWPAQITATVGCVIVSSTITLLTSRYYLFYAPPNRMGTLACNYGVRTRNLGMSKSKNLA